MLRLYEDWSLILSNISFDWHPKNGYIVTVLVHLVVCLFCCVVAYYYYLIHSLYI